MIAELYRETWNARAKDEKIRPTPFCLIFGQAQQYFLKQLYEVPNGVPPKTEKRLSPQHLNSPAKLEQAPFVPWERSDPTQSFRWDPIEDRRYALRFKDPSPDTKLTMHGTNRLACIALPLLTAVPRQERGEIRLYALATRYEDGALTVRWPIWPRPAGLKSILMMLAGCGADDRFPGPGVTDIYRSERIAVNKLFNFTRAHPISRTV